MDDVIAARMTSLDNAPASVRGWFAAEKSADPAAALRAVLARDVVFNFLPDPIRGLDAVLEALTFIMPPGWLGEVEWTLLPEAKDGRVTVRGTGPGGAPLPSDGGPMDVIDFAFTLGADGLITGIAPQPHHPEAGDVAPPLRPGDRAPDFVLPDVHGAAVPLRQEGARATVVIFTCNHCPWSLRWHDRLQQVARDYAPQGVRVLQINPNGTAVNAMDGADQSRKRVAEGQFAGPYLIDEGQAVARRWGARNTPELFVLDARGLVAYHGAPDAEVDNDSLNAGWLRGALDRVLAGRAPDPAETKVVGCSIKWM